MGKEVQDFADRIDWSILLTEEKDSGGSPGGNGGAEESSRRGTGKRQGRERCWGPDGGT